MLQEQVGGERKSGVGDTWSVHAGFSIVEGYYDTDGWINVKECEETVAFLNINRYTTNNVSTQSIEQGGVRSD